MRLEVKKRALQGVDTTVEQLFTLRCPQGKAQLRAKLMPDLSLLVEVHQVAGKVKLIAGCDETATLTEEKPDYGYEPKRRRVLNIQPRMKP